MEKHLAASSPTPVMPPPLLQAEVERSEPSVERKGVKFTVPSSITSSVEVYIYPKNRLSIIELAFDCYIWQHVLACCSC